MRKGKLFLTAAMCCTMLLSVGCGKKKTTDYSKYVELGEYKGIEVVKESTEVTDQDVMDAINATLESNKETVEVKDREIKDGDIANIDYVGTVDGKEFEGGKDTEYDLTIGSGKFIEGFEEQLIGHKAGDVVTVKVTFPEDYHGEDVAGKDAEFKVTINKVSEKVTPELTDAWVENYTKNSQTPAKTVKEYKNAEKKRLQAAKIEAADIKKTADVLTKIVENSTIKGYPEDEVDAYVNSNLEYYEMYAKDLGTKLEDLLAMMGQDKDKFMEETRKTGEATIARQMVCKLIAEKEGMTITDEEYAEGLKEYAAQYSTQNNSYTPESFEKAYGKDVVTENLLIEKVLDFITESAVEVDDSSK